ncbi:hypothetical protein K0M31_007882 [Melipona bicolor]|uniref:Uncharacterized protein n=1 Tax=Melipona bicolor TaxID=60889 RepID=A0AA40GC77_9HYME|nr:hypothetical protein K0M31_007882 [Melipona bicolor]
MAGNKGLAGERRPEEKDAPRSRADTAAAEHPSPPNRSLFRALQFSSSCKTSARLRLPPDTPTPFERFLQRLLQQDGCVTGAHRSDAIARRSATLRYDSQRLENTRERVDSPGCVGTGALCIRRMVGRATTLPSKDDEDNEDDDDDDDDDDGDDDGEEEDLDDAGAARGAQDPLYKSLGCEQFLSVQEVEQYPFLRSLPTVRLPCLPPYNSNREGISRCASAV